MFLLIASYKVHQITPILIRNTELTSIRTSFIQQLFWNFQLGRRPGFLPANLKTQLTSNFPKWLTPSKLETRNSSTEYPHFQNAVTIPLGNRVSVVPKKINVSGEQNWTVVMNNKKQNVITVDDKHPLSIIFDLLDELGKWQMFTNLDLASGFHHIEVHPKDIHETEL